MTFVVLAVSAVVASLVAAVARPGVESRRAPSLRIAVAAPLTVTGTKFRAHERVRITATVASGKESRAVTAGRTGRLRIVFGQLAASRCDLVRVVAARRSGRLVVVKRLPAPACSLG
jgi:hypothetical protein